MDSNAIGELALMKVMLDLTNKGYTVFAPVGEPKIAIDIIAYKDKKTYRLQVKQSKTGEIRHTRYNRRAKGIVKTIYENDAFDYYAIYLPTIDKIIYPAFNFGGKFIAPTPRLYGEFYWYKDFLDFTDNAPKRTPKELNIEPHKRKCFGVKKPQTYKVKRPTPKDLQELLWKKSTVTIAKELNVSDNCIARWAKEYNLTKPPRGYWARKYAGKL